MYGCTGICIVLVLTYITTTYIFLVAYMSVVFIALDSGMRAETQTRVFPKTMTQTATNESDFVYHIYSLPAPSIESWANYTMHTGARVDLHRL